VGRSVQGKKRTLQKNYLWAKAGGTREEMKQLDGLETMRKKNGNGSWRAKNSCGESHEKLSGKEDGGGPRRKKVKERPTSGGKFKVSRKKKKVKVKGEIGALDN